MAEVKKPTPREAIPEIFKDSFFKSETGSKRKILVFPVALILHIAVIGGLIVIPLLSTATLPTVEVYSAFLAPPAASPAPPAAAGQEARLRTG